MGAEKTHRAMARLYTVRVRVQAVSNRKHKSKDGEGITVGDASSAKTNASNIEAKASHLQREQCLPMSWNVKGVEP